MAVINVVLVLNISGGSGPILVQSGVQEVPYDDATIQSESVALVPLPKSVQYTHRPMSHLTMSQRTLRPTNLPAVNMTFLDGSTQALKKESLYSFDNYIQGFEGAVTHAWISILNSFQPDTHIVVDGGMNVGFYTLLTAIMGYTVHSFELQLDCFDVSRRLLDANQINDKYLNLYHVGIGTTGEVITVGEGCDPSHGIKQSQKGTTPASTGDWQKRTHQVGLVSLDTLFDQKLGDKKVALIKLDIEGAEVLALQGLKRHVRHVENIILECAPSFLRRYTSLEKVKETFKLLETDGFRAYKLYSFKLTKEKWHDMDFLGSAGLKEVKIHPIVGGSRPMPEGGTTIMWEIVNWDLFFVEACPVGCNILFHRETR